MATNIRTSFRALWRDRGRAKHRWPQRTAPKAGIIVGGETARIELSWKEAAYRLSVDILVTLGPGENPLVTCCYNRLLMDSPPPLWPRARKIPPKTLAPCGHEAGRQRKSETSESRLKVPFRPKSDGPCRNRRGHSSHPDFWLGTADGSLRRNRVPAAVESRWL